MALLIETSRRHGRQIVDGVARYAAEYGPWSLRLEPRNLDDRPPGWLRSWQGDGIIACDDEQAHLVLDTALSLGLRVPDDVAVMGIDNDEVFCRASTPQLSSVDVNAFAVGYQEAVAVAPPYSGGTPTLGWRSSCPTSSPSRPTLDPAPAMSPR